MSPTPCKACGETIDFVRLKSGKFCPVDLDLERWEDMPYRFTMVTEDGECVFKTLDNEDCYRGLEGFINHFNTCSHALENIVDDDF